MNQTAKLDAFEQEVEHIINKYSLESPSNTPDFILASYLRGCLDNWNAHVKQKRDWEGKP